MRKLLPILSLLSILVLSGCACMQTEPMAKAAPAMAKAAPAPAPTPMARTTRVVFSPQAIMIEKTSPANVLVGEPFEYKMKATNMTDQTLSEVLLEDKLPGNFKYISSSPEGTLRGSVLTWMLGEMKPNESRMITVRGQATETGALKNCASATFKFYTCAETMVVQPMLKLVAAAPRQVMVCEDIPIKLTLMNTGTGDAEDVKVMAALPEGLKTAEGASSIAMSVGTLPPGKSVEKTVMVKASGPGTYKSRPVATGTGLKAESEELSTKVVQPILAITKSGPDRQEIGQRVSYDITVVNKGDAVASETVLQDTISGRVTAVQISDQGTMDGGTVTWNLGNLSPGAAKKVTISYIPSDVGTARNTAEVKAVCADQVKAAASTEIVGVPAVLLEVIDVADPVELGQNETYIITVTNQGTAKDTGIAIKAMLEDNMQFVSATGATNGTFSGGTVTFVPLANLDPKTKATWKVTVKAVKVGDVRFRVTMDTDQLTRPVEETEATNFYE